MEEHTGTGETSTSIAEQARGAGDGGAAYESLKHTLQQASPNERSAAAKELVDDPAAYETLHRALQGLGIEETADGSDRVDDEP